MSRTVDLVKLSPLASRFGAFVAERHPLALDLVLEVFEFSGGGKLKVRDAAAIEALRVPFRRELARRLYTQLTAPEGLPDTTPGDVGGEAAGAGAGRGRGCV